MGDNDRWRWGNKAEAVKTSGAGSTGVAHLGKVRARRDRQSRPARRHAASSGVECAEEACLGMTLVLTGLSERGARGRGFSGRHACGPGDGRVEVMLSGRWACEDNTCQHTPCLSYGREAEIDAGCGKHGNIHMSSNGTSGLPFLAIAREESHICKSWRRKSVQNPRNMCRAASSIRTPHVVHVSCSQLTRTPANRRCAILGSPTGPGHLDLLQLRQTHPEESLSMADIDMNQFPPISPIGRRRVTSSS